ncbi:MAG: RNA polymerase sigma factor [Clostridia bacterium]|nr:RNA polymerase sigma factor [Clostridia bacterium]
MQTGENSYRRYLEGDEDAFTEVLELYYNNLTLFINGYLGDIHASADVAIDTMLELIVHKKRYSFKSSLKTYLFAIARHKALNHLKKHRRILPVSPDELELSDMNSLEAEVIESERKRSLHRAIAELDSDMQTAVHLVYIEGMSYKQAASVMKKSAKQLDNLITSAKRRLKAELSEVE